MKTSEFFKAIISNQFIRYSLIFIAAFAIYAQTLNYSLVNDDDCKFTDSCSANYSQPYSVIKAFQNDVFYGNMTVFFYRPVLSISFIIDNKIAGAAPFQAHLTNVLLHCVCALLVLFFCSRHLFAPLPSFLAALLFAVHPVTIQTVAWIAGRNDSLLFIFFISCLIFFKEYLSSKKPFFLLLHFIFLLLCLYTKENALAVPFLLLGFYILNRKEESKLPFYVYLLWILSLAVFLASKHTVLPNQLSGNYLLFSKETFAAFFDHISAVIFFRAPMAEHTEIKIFILGIISSLLILFFGFYKRSYAQIKENLFYIIVIIAFLLPDFINGIPFAGRTTFQGNRVYIPLFCIIVLFFSFCKTLIQTNFKLEKMLYGFIAILIVLSSYIILSNSEVYKNDLTFWTRVIEESKSTKLLPVIYHVDALINHGLYEEALKETSLFAELSGYKSIAVVRRLAVIYKILGDNEKADYYTSLVKQLLIEREPK